MNRSDIRLFSIFGTLALAGATLLGGCYKPGGSGFSTDTFTYPSTSWQPCTITLKDTRTDQAIWSIDVPVGKQLVIDFRKDEGIPGSGTPDLMRWEIMDIGEQFGELDNSLPVPPAPDGRRVDHTLRPAPELPESMGGGVPKPSTSPGNPG